MTLRKIGILSMAITLATCTTSDGPTLPENYHSDLETWKQDRDKRLRAENGWVNLAGLFWLEEGRNTFGSATGNTVVFPEYAASNLGTMILEDSVLIFEPGEEEVMVDTVPTDGPVVVYDAANGIQRVMEHDRYRWFIIERAGNFGIRLRDLEHPKTQGPLGIEYFEWSEDWYLKAKYRPFDEPQKVTIDNVVGFSFEEVFEGEFVFEVHGKQYSVWPSISETSSFIMFADQTSGEESYGAGRYLVAPVPDEHGNVIIDFNKAYNPPCGFTDFATCPLPPEANFLDVEVRAGEKAWH